MPFSFSKCWYFFIWYCQPWSECNIKFVLSGILLNAFSSISTTCANTGCLDKLKLITSPLNKSTIGDKYIFSLCTLNSVTSVTHFWFGLSASNSLFKRLSQIFPTSPLYDLYFYTLTKHCNPNSFIIFETVLWFIINPLLCSSIVILLYPYLPLFSW